MTTLEAQPEYQRMDIQKQIQELLTDIRKWQDATAGNIPALDPKQKLERERIARIGRALQYARDCK